jgi:hypothetical protein
MLRFSLHRFLDFYLSKLLLMGGGLGTGAAVPLSELADRSRTLLPVIMAPAVFIPLYFKLFPLVEV